MECAVSRQSWLLTVDRRRKVGKGSFTRARNFSEQGKYYALIVRDIANAVRQIHGSDDFISITVWLINMNFFYRNNGHSKIMTTKFVIKWIILLWNWQKTLLLLSCYKELGIDLSARMMRQIADPVTKLVYEVLDLVWKLVYNVLDSVR